MRIVIADVEEAALEAAVAELKGRNADVLGICLDVRDRDAWARAADEVAETFGPVHVLCNNAGVGGGGPIQDQSFKDWDWTLGVNLDGVVNGLQTFMGKMVEHGEPAHVVNTASMAGIFGAPRMSTYCASKFAVVGLSESMAADLAATSVRVSVLCPAFVRTNIFEAQRNRPEELQNDAPVAHGGTGGNAEGNHGDGDPGGARRRVRPRCGPRRTLLGDRKDNGALH